MNGPYLVRMSDAEFENLPTKVVPRTIRLEDPGYAGTTATEWIFIGYCERLLYKNDKLEGLFQRFIERRDDPDCWNCLTQGQQVLYSLAALDGEVRNGGITQFFWNCADLAFPVNDALAAVEAPELAAAYEKALEGLLGKKDTWFELKYRFRNGPNKEDWMPFLASYDLLDLDWFDDPYFKKYGPSLITLLVKYVRANRAEFIEP